MWEKTFFNYEKDGLFCSHLEYFLKNKHRWENADSIIDRIFWKKISDENKRAWEQKRNCRSAQAEITSIYIIENYLDGIVKNLEQSKPNSKKSCDILATFHDKNDYYIEVKAQSGQQHGDKHPLSNGLISFNPHFENDLLSWLFEIKVSSRNGSIMRPYVLQASDKKADVLMVMTDIFYRKAGNLKEFIKNNFCNDNNIFGIKKSVREFKKNKLKLYICKAAEKIAKKMGTLKEIWLFDESKICEMAIILGKNLNKSVIQNQ